MQLNSNKYFKEILEAEIKSEFVIADVLRNSDRQKEFTFSFEEISLDITRQLISSKQFAKLKLLGRANNFEDDKKKLFDEFIKIHNLKDILETAIYKKTFLYDV